MTNPAKRDRLRANCFHALILASATAAAACAQWPAAISNPGFEQGNVGEPPPGWPSAVGCSAALTDHQPFEGEQCLQLAHLPNAPRSSPFGNLMTSLDAAEFRGRRIRFSAAVRYEGPGKAQLWMRADRPNAQTGFFDNMGDRPITGNQWKRYSITGQIDADAESLHLGIMLIAGGRLWLDDVKLQDVTDQPTGDDPPAKLSDQQARNVVACAKLLGYVRYFHPSDESAQTDWESLSISSMRAVERAGNDEELIQALRRAIAPIAPTLKIGIGTPPRTIDPQALRPEGARPAQTVCWLHNGVGLNPQTQGLYASKRVYHDWPAVEPHAGFPDPGTVLIKELAAGVWCALPISLYVQDGRTLPRDEAPPPAASDRPEGWQPSANDRATRLAGIAIGWNVMQHFYPYFDVVDAEWDAALLEGVRAAAEAADARAYLDAVSAMIAKLRDGHGFVFSHAANLSTELPFLLQWVGEALVVLASANEEIKRGDVILELDARTSGQWWDETSRLISGATPGWIRYRSAQMIRTHMPTADPVAIRFRRIDGSEHTLSVKRVPMGLSRLDDLIPMPQNGAELGPGVVYFNLSGAGIDMLNDAMPALSKARGIIFDLRGYPSDAGTEVLRHLADQPLRSAQWHVPRVVLPDQERMTFTRLAAGEWLLPPQKPRFTARVAFIVDGRAISYAESCMGIVEHYRLGRIVGETTAGTNGNVNPFAIPGGITINWTGMRVLKHDGSAHHGVGIVPTDPVGVTVKGIASGADEMLERAIAILCSSE